MTRRNARPHHSGGRAPEPEAPARLCDFSGCDCAGEYRAPKARDMLNSYWWFCLDHVRAYNAGWDFYKGMSPGQIEAQLRADIAWQRPSWPLGRLGGAYVNEESVLDPLKLLAGRKKRGKEAAAVSGAPPELREPLSVLGLRWPVTLADVKTRYKELAKQHHPDANGGDRTAEERLKTINLAYASLKRGLIPERLAAAG